MSMDRDEPSSLLSFSSNHPLEQFILLAKGAKGSACAELIKQVLEAPGVHVFGELLEMPNIKEVSFRKVMNNRATMFILTSTYYIFKFLHYLRMNNIFYGITELDII